MPKIVITTDNAGVLDKLVGLGINMNIQIEPDGAPAPAAPKVSAAPAAIPAAAPAKATRKREPVKRQRARSTKVSPASPVSAGSTEDRARKIHASVKSGAAVTMGELEKHLGLGKIKIRGVVESMKQGKFGDELRLHMAGRRGDAVYGVTAEQAKQRHAERAAKGAPPVDTRPVGPVKKRTAVKRRVVEREPSGAE